MKKSVYIIIVTYNALDHLPRLLPSLANSNYPVNTIFIDNNSSDNTVEILQNYDGIKMNIIASDVNHGFGKANNIGISKALEEKADYLFLLNQDTWIFPDTIGRLVTIAEDLQTNNNLGILSPCHYSSDEQNFEKGFETYFNHSSNTKISKYVKTNFVNAAAWFLPRTTVEKFGNFSALFSHYGEDLNFCDRITYAEYSIIITDPETKIVHNRNIQQLNISKLRHLIRVRMLCTIVDPKIKNLFLAFIRASKSIFIIFKKKYSFSFTSRLKVMFYVGTFFLKDLCKWKVYKKARKEFRLIP